MSPLSFVALAMSGPLIKPKPEAKPPSKWACARCGTVKGAKHFLSTSSKVCQPCAAKDKLARSAKRKAGVTEP